MTRSVLCGGSRLPSGGLLALNLQSPCHAQGPDCLPHYLLEVLLWSFMTRSVKDIKSVLRFSFCGHPVVSAPMLGRLSSPRRIAFAPLSKVS